jgi:hypothetical protein
MLSRLPGVSVSVTFSPSSDPDTGTEIVPETSSIFNELTWLKARESFVRNTVKYSFTCDTMFSSLTPLAFKNLVKLPEFNE